MIESALEAHEKIAKERKAIMARARAEVEAEWNKKFKEDDKQVALNRQIHEDHMASRRRIEKELADGWVGVGHFDQKGEDTFDRIVGKPKRGRGRPRGSKNKPKPSIVRPNQIGATSALDLDLILPR